MFNRLDFHPLLFLTKPCNKLFLYENLEVNITSLMVYGLMLTANVLQLHAGREFYSRTAYETLLFIPHLRDYFPGHEAEPGLRVAAVRCPLFIQ